VQLGKVLQPAKPGEKINNINLMQLQQNDQVGQLYQSMVCPLCTPNCAQQLVLLKYICKMKSLIGCAVHVYTPISQLKATCWHLKL
jgi:hypothetical protein